MLELDGDRVLIEVTRRESAAEEAAVQQTDESDLVEHFGQNDCDDDDLSDHTVHNDVLGHDDMMTMVITPVAGTKRWIM